MEKLEGIVVTYKDVSKDTLLTANTDSAYTAETEEKIKLDSVKIGIIRDKDLMKRAPEERQNMEVLAEDIIWMDTTTEDGAFSMDLVKERDYHVIFERDGFIDTILPTAVVQQTREQVLHKMSEETAVDSNYLKTEEKEKVSLSLDMDKETLEKNKDGFVIDNMYFEYDMDLIKKSSKPAIDLLYQFMSKYPKARVQIEGHTDAMGDDDYNMDLSQRRAESVMHEMEDLGIAPNRMKARGYGETKPIAPNTKPDGSDNPSGRRKNRRTEITILSLD
jgi:outer membrane protein OmpA-like peptidoglycan-associated protein